MLPNVYGQKRVPLSDGISKCMPIDAEKAERLYGW
jgi:hypothetical protein